MTARSWVARFFGEKDGPAEDATPEQVAAALKRARIEFEAARAEVAELVRQRAKILLNGSDKDLRAHDEGTAETQRTLERLEASIPALQELLLKARERKAKADDTERRQQLEDAHERYEANLGRYVELTAELVPLIEQLREDDRLCDRLRQTVPGFDMPNHAFRPNNTPIHQLAVIPPGSAEGAVYHPEASGRLAWRLPPGELEYRGPVHSLPEVAALSDGSGRPRRRGAQERGELHPFRPE